jgi:kynureninase
VKDYQNKLEFARQSDEQDGLKNVRKEFLIPIHQNKEAIYFLGNSLGLQPKRTATFIQQVSEQWARYGVEGFFKGSQPWLTCHQQLLPVLSEILGALPQEVTVMNQLTVNLHLMLASFYQPNGKRRKIVCEAKAFPSDQYMLYSHVKQRGLDPDDIVIEVQPRNGETIIREEDILNMVEENKNEIALLFFGGVNYYSGQVFNMQALSNAAHSIGVKIGLDLAHAAGNVPLQLHDWNIDFACWCSYKYLNSGPGAIGGVFVHERYHRDASLNRFAGWWGNKKETQFLMQKNFEPETSAEGWQLSTPSPVLYAMHRAALDVFQEAGIGNVFKKNQLLNEYLWFVLEETKRETPVNAIQIITPRHKDQRGCQISMIVQNGKKIFDFLSAKGVFADWREPDVIRIAPVGLYNTFEEVWQFGQILKEGINSFANDTSAIG